MPTVVRSLATSLQTQTERCLGSLRGPVLWSETMSARASSFGDEGLFVCKTPSRAYDIDENRVLVAALMMIRDAARGAEHNNERALDDPLLRAARRNGNEANRFAQHPSLARVTRERPNARAIKRTRSGKHRRSYQPALDMLERYANPLDAQDVWALCDERTRAQHQALVGLMQRLERHGLDPPARLPGRAWGAVHRPGAVLPRATAGRSHPSLGHRDRSAAGRRARPPARSRADVGPRPAWPPGPARAPPWW